MNDTNKAKLKEKIMKLARNEIRITYSENGAVPDAAASKIGGRPALPADFQWEEYTGKGYFNDEPESRPLSFLAQINLKDIEALDTENLLPKTGVLSFFYELISMEWGFNTADKGCARVYYFPDESVLAQRDFPDNMEQEAMLPEFAMKLKKHISLPSVESYPESDEIEDWDDYTEACAECGYEYDEWGEYTKLLGYPDVIQSPMEQECESISRGYNCGNPEDYAKIPQEELPDIEEKSKEWTLLFQMGTIETEDMELMFGDCGHIYFWIRKEDLKNRNFDNVWLVLQCS